MVGMGEIKTTTQPDDTLMALGLGSCVGVCAFDPQAGIAGLAHVVLPDSGGCADTPGKFADTAVPQLLDAMTRLGAHPARIQVALAGGAQLFAFKGGGPRLEIGLRNAEAVTACLKARNIPVMATDLGGNAGRTVHFKNDGRVRVKTIGQGERELARLGGSEAPPRAASARF